MLHIVRAGYCDILQACVKEYVLNVLNISTDCFNLFYSCLFSFAVALNDYV